jgi:hypothetical protein
LDRWLKRMLKYVRIAVTVLCLTACVLLVAQWVRSLWKPIYHKEFVTPKYRYELTSRSGKFVFVRRERFFISLEFTLAYPETMMSDLTERTRFGIGRFSSDNFSGFSIAYWLLIPVAMIVAAIPWLPWSTRFSLRTLLIATTLVAVGLGIVVALR